MNIRHMRCISATWFVALVTLSCACAANPSAFPQTVNTPALAANERTANTVTEILADNGTATGAAPPEPDTQGSEMPVGANGPETISAKDTGKLNRYNGKEVIVEGTVVELGVLVNPDVGKAMVLYLNNANQHVTSYEAWSKGMTGTDFRVIIREVDIPRFCYGSMFVGRGMAVKGKIDIYNSAPVIFVSDPSQITFAGTPAATEPSLSMAITRSTETADNITYYRYQGTITNTNIEWAIHDLYLGENKLADCVAPKGCPNIAAQYFGKQILTQEIRCASSVKFDLKFSAGTVGAGTDPLTKQVELPALRYTWKGLPQK